MRKLLYLELEVDHSVGLYEILISNDGLRVDLHYGQDESLFRDVRGQSIGSIDDDGNQAKLTMGDQEITLDHSQLTYLRHLLTAYFEDSGQGDPLLELRRFKEIGDD